MPWFAVHVYGGNSATLGLLLGSAGLGAVSGMLYLAMRPSIRGLFRLIAVYASTAGTALLAFAFCRVLPLGMLLVFFIGGGLMLSAASTNTILQTLVPDEMRGRIASIYVMSFLGLAPMGALIGGWVAERYGPPVTLAAGGVLVLASAMVYFSTLPAIRREIRPLYERLGIVPPPQS